MVEEKKNIPKVRFREFAGDDANAWELRKLGLLASFTKGNGYSKKDLVQDSNQTPIILYGSLYTNYKTNIEKVDTFARVKDKTIYSSGNDVVVPASGESAEDISRASAILKKGIILGGDLNIIHPLPDLNAIFLAITISNGTQKRELSRRAQGKSVVHLRNQDLKQVNLLYPNLEEQQKIGSFFKHLDELITLHQRELDNYKMLKKTMLSKMFPKNDEKYPEIRFTGFAYAWELRKLGEVAKRYDNLRIPISEGKRERGNIPYYGANGIQDYVKGFTHQGEFVLVAEDGANDVINYPVRYVEGKIWVNNHAHVLQGKKDILDNHFLTYIIKSIKIAPFLVGGSRSKLNSNTMMNMSINVAPFREQQKIGTLFKHLDSLITLHQRELESLKTLKKNLLQQMFV